MTGACIKRLTDIVVSAAALILLIPVFALVAMAVWFESGRPILFRHERVGLGFRRFHILKFRTMHVANRGPEVTVGGDPRVTRVGRFLRLSKLDELPQFWNVVRGDMSLVGPRPEVPRYVAKFEPRYRFILTIRPGITDLASIRFRNEEDILRSAQDPLREYEEHILPRKLALAEEYIRSASPLTDLRIAFNTIRTILVRN